MKVSAVRRIILELSTDGTMEQCTEICRRIAEALPQVLVGVAAPLAVEKEIEIDWKVTGQKLGGPAGQPASPPDQRLRDVELFAWLGEDELGSGELGLKQARVPAGLIPMVSILKEKMQRRDVLDGLTIQALIFKKEISLCRFTFAGVEEILRPALLSKP
jgi:hypothetical protein